MSDESSGDSSSDGDDAEELHPHGAQAGDWGRLEARLDEFLEEVQRIRVLMESIAQRLEALQEQNRMLITRMDNLEREMNEEREERAKMRREIKEEVPQSAVANLARNAVLGVAITGGIFGAVYLAAFTYLKSYGIPDWIIKRFLQQLFQDIGRIAPFLNFFRYIGRIARFFLYIVRIAPFLNFFR